MKEPKKNINDEIKAKNVQLITDDWENLWIMPLKEALEKASEIWLDLMEMSKKDDLVIAKLIDYWKYLYRLKKLDQKNKQKSKTPELKTIRITFNISENDLNVKRKQAFSFAKDWNPIKLVLVLKWRENQYWEIARTKILNFITSLEEYYKLDNNVSRVWNMLSANLKPIK